MELKTLLQHRPGKEPVAEVQKVVSPVSSVQVKPKMTEKKSETPKMTSSNPFPRRVSTRKKKEPTPAPTMEMEEERSSEDVEEVDIGTRVV